MPITIDGNGSITGINAGGLPDGVIVQADLASGVAGNGPAFSAYQSSAQSLSSGTLTKLTFTTEDFDTANCFASSRFTPNVAGYYLITGGVRSDSSISALHIYLTRNNTFSFAAGSFTNTTLSAFMSSTTGIVYLNGTTDYVEANAYSGANITLTTGNGATYFQGALIRSA